MATGVDTAYGYDAYGRRTTMKTYRDGSGWDGTSWPTSTTGDADHTAAILNLIALQESRQWADYWQNQKCA